MRLLIILLLTSNFSFAQYWGGQEINPSDLTNWIPKFQSEYAGTYHFGESESESDFHLFFAGDCIIGQVHYGYWEENTDLRKSMYITLTNIKIDKDGNFTSNQHIGKFVTYKSESGTVYKALKINNPWTSWIDESEFEIGTRTNLVLDNIYYGTYGKASFMKLDINDLKKLTQWELNIMKNEIYARYGYKFTKNSKMDNYFRTKDWYRPEHNDVTNFLNEIEIYNIGIINQLE
ncbi:YARHG domain-containing protein [Winogradskyella sp. PC D3.3]